MIKFLCPVIIKLKICDCTCCDNVPACAVAETIMKKVLLFTLLNQRVISERNLKYRIFTQPFTYTEKCDVCVTDGAKCGHFINNEMFDLKHKITA